MLVRQTDVPKISRRPPRTTAATAPG